MNAGRTASLVLLVILAAAATAVSIGARSVPSVQTAAPALQWLMIGAAVALVFAIILVPLGLALDRSIARLRTHIESTGATDEQPAALAGPKWLSPITRAITGAIDQFIQREQNLRIQLRDLEIRHRVSEAERRQIEAVLHSLRDGVLVTDAFNEIVMANEAAANVLEFDLSKAIHQPLDRVITDRKLCQHVRDARENINFVDRRHVEHEIRADRDDDRIGRTRPRVYDVTLTCVENHKHEVGGVVTILHDLTREREISEMKSDFVSKASHELRTPLSSIRAYVEMLVDGEATDEQSRREFYQIIHNETDRLGRLIDNMLNISRIEAGIVQIDREQVDIKGLVNRAVDSLEPQAKTRRIALHKKLSPVDLSVEGDADMLYQVVLNLLSNAVKYTPEEGRITISADSDNLTRSVVVTIADTGLGIPPDALPKLFDKFYRVENFKRVAKGTGLGLNLCKHIVETVHHGQIGVDSELGMGSKFWFTIPMRYAGSQAAA